MNSRIILLFFIVSVISYAQADWRIRVRGRKFKRYVHAGLKIWSIAHGDEHGDEQQKKNAAAMTQFLDNLSDEAGQENARKFIKDVAKMIEDEENDVKLADQFDINEANSNQARNEEDQTKEEKTNEDTDAQAKEDAELMQLLRSLKENL